MLRRESSGGGGGRGAFCDFFLVLVRKPNPSLDLGEVGRTGIFEVDSAEGELIFAQDGKFIVGGEGNERSVGSSSCFASRKGSVGSAFLGRNRRGEDFGLDIWNDVAE